MMKNGRENRLAQARQGAALETQASNANDQTIQTNLSDVQSTMMNQARRLTVGIIREVAEHVQPTRSHNY